MTLVTHINCINFIKNKKIIIKINNFFYFYYNRYLTVTYPQWKESVSEILNEYNIPK